MDVALLMQCLWLAKRLFTTFHAESCVRGAAAAVFHSIEVSRLAGYCRLLRLTTTTFQLTQMPASRAAKKSACLIYHTEAANNRGGDAKMGALKGSVPSIRQPHQQLACSSTVKHGIPQPRVVCQLALSGQVGRVNNQGRPTAAVRYLMLRVTAVRPTRPRSKSIYSSSGR